MEEKELSDAGIDKTGVPPSQKKPTVNFPFGESEQVDAM
jgi:hypothetical protein